MTRVAKQIEKYQLMTFECLGSKLQKILYETVIRFRREKEQYNIDIKKMFNQVQLTKDKWNLQGISDRRRQPTTREY